MPRAMPAAAVGVLLSLAGSTLATTGLVVPMKGAEIDWGAGMITARAGAAADFRAPSPDVARPGAERRAQAEASRKLRAALAALPLGAGKTIEEGAMDALVAKAQIADRQYQSNGGVVLALSLTFADLVSPAAGLEAARAISVASSGLELAPALEAGTKVGRVGLATYRLGTPPASAKAVSVRRGAKGQLILAKEDSDELEKLSGARVVIYVRKVLR